MGGFGDDILRSGVKRLKRNDAKMADVIKKVGAPRIPHVRGRFASLVRSILSQQISGAAARTIQSRLTDRIGPFTAESIAGLSVDELRSLGVSNQKAGYLLDLAEKTQARELRFHRHTKMDDEAVIEELIAVRGIGRWTAQMYLIFSLSRCDVFPEDDLGVRKGMQQIYGLDSSGDRPALREIAVAWRPYSSLASWYCWRILEVEN
jgi:DNA-3-methyladenine glycosylase II